MRFALEHRDQPEPGGQHEVQRHEEERQHHRQGIRPERWHAPGTLHRETIRPQPRHQSVEATGLSDIYYLLFRQSLGLNLESVPLSECSPPPLHHLLHQKRGTSSGENSHQEFSLSESPARPRNLCGDSGRATWSKRLPLHEFPTTATVPSFRTGGRACRGRPPRAPGDPQPPG